MPERKAHKDSPWKQEEQVIAEAEEGNGGRKLNEEAKKKDTWTVQMGSG